MKKIIIPLIGIILVALGLVGWRSSTVAQPMSCADTVSGEINIMSIAWQKNLATMMDQEKPASEMVDEGFESLRTYRCWLDYLCEAVLYSANADPKATRIDPDDPSSAQRTLVSSRFFELIKGEIDTVPGCAYSDALEIPGTKIQYLPACAVGGTNMAEGAYKNYSQCRSQVERNFAGSGDPATSSAFIALRRTLKSNSAEQVVRPLREKFSSILLKMSAMEAHMSTLVGQVESLDSRLPCYAKECI